MIFFFPTYLCPGMRQQNPDHRQAQDPSNPFYGILRPSCIVCSCYVLVVLRRSVVVLHPSVVVACFPTVI